MVKVSFEMDNIPEGIRADDLRNILCAALNEYQTHRSGVHGTAENYVADRYAGSAPGWQKEKAESVRLCERAAEAMRNACARRVIVEGE